MSFILVSSQTYNDELLLMKVLKTYNKRHNYQWFKNHKKLNVSIFNY